MSDSEVFYTLFDEVEQGFVGVKFLGTGNRENGQPRREKIDYYGDYTDRHVVTFSSPEAADKWLAPDGGYDRSRATLVRVTVKYAAEAV
jgi:hypothetical protein